jgi:hypothetical protein
VIHNMLRRHALISAATSARVGPCSTYNQCGLCLQGAAVQISLAWNAWLPTKILSALQAVAVDAIEKMRVPRRSVNAPPLFHDQLTSAFRVKLALGQKQHRDSDQMASVSLMDLTLPSLVRHPQPAVLDSVAYSQVWNGRPQWTVQPFPDVSNAESAGPCTDAATERSTCNQSGQPSCTIVQQQSMVM